MKNKWVIEYRLSPSGNWNLVLGELSEYTSDFKKDEMIRLADRIIHGKTMEIEYRLRNVDTNEMMNEEQIRDSAVPQMEGH